MTVLIDFNHNIVHHVKSFVYYHLLADTTSKKLKSSERNGHAKFVKKNYSSQPSNINNTPLTKILKENVSHKPFKKRIQTAKLCILRAALRNEICTVLGIKKTEASVTMLHQIIFHLKKRRRCETFFK